MLQEHSVHDEATQLLLDALACSGWAHLAYVPTWHTVRAARLPLTPPCRWPAALLLPPTSARAMGVCPSAIFPGVVLPLLLPVAAVEVTW